VPPISTAGKAGTIRRLHSRTIIGMNCWRMSALVVAGNENVLHRHSQMKDPAFILNGDDASRRVTRVTRSLFRLG
jgi:hypothetical protein